MKTLYRIAVNEDGTFTMFVDEVLERSVTKYIYNNSHNEEINESLSQLEKSIKNYKKTIKKT